MADHPRSSDQQEADAATSKGCGMFDFLKKKSEDVPSSENAAGVTSENKQEEKPSLAETLHLSDSSSSSSDEEGGENREKKKKKKKDKVSGHNKEDVADQRETEEKKGIVEKIKEKLPEAKGHDDQSNKSEHDQDGKEKGFMEKMKEKLPGGHHVKPETDPHHDIVIDNGKEKGFIEKIMEKLPGHGKHEDDDEKKK